MSELDRTDTEESNEDQSESIARDAVVARYTYAADVVNIVLKDLVARCKAGQSIRELCDFGDQQIVERLSKVFKKKDIKKGVAFPTCISVNHVVCNYSPLKSEPDVQLANGDLVKIELAAHVDGYIAPVGHSFLLSAEDASEKKVSGRAADVILAAHYALEAALRMLKPGRYRNIDVSDVLQKVVASYDCRLLEGMVSFSLKRFKIDGPVHIIQRPNDRQRLEVEKHEFGNHEVYALGVYVSTGDGKARQGNSRTTVYKRNEEVVYHLKMKASRAFFSEMDHRFGLMAFTLRSFEDEVKTKVGVNESEKHNLLLPYQVMCEREGDLVAHFKSTVLVLPTGIIKLTGLQLAVDNFESNHKVRDSNLVDLITSSLKIANKKKKPATAKVSKDGKVAEAVKT